MFYNTTDFAICIEDNFGIILNINDGKIYHQNEILGEIEQNKIYTIQFNKLSKNVINIKLYNEYNEELMSLDINCYALQSMSYISTNCNIDS